jgi:biopolymer transport protein ExbD
MKLKHKEKGPFFIPTFSMSDIAFLLLIFIMVIALTSYRKEVKIDYPEATTVLNTGAERNLEVWIDREGGVYIAGDPASLGALEQAIINFYITAPDTRIHIIADRYTPYEKINAAIEVMQMLQYRTVSFVVKNVE